MFNKESRGSKNTSGIGSANVKRYTTAQINALTGMIEGDVVFDTDLQELKIYSGSVWETNGTPESLVIAYAAAL